MNRRIDNARILGNVPTIINTAPLRKTNTITWKKYALLLIVLLIIFKYIYQ